MSEELSLFERVRFDREAGSVERCHVRPHLLRYSVGHHTHDVMGLIIHCWREDHEGKLPRPELLVAAFAHDKGELVSGDVPSPTKDLLGEQLEELDTRVERSLYGNVNLTEEERRYLLTADRFELWLWCREEVERGNRSFLPWARSCWTKLEGLDFTGFMPPAFVRLWREYDKTEALALTGSEIMSVGGLK